MAIKNYTPEELKSMINELASPDQRELAECRKLVDDCLAGQKTIKAKEEYLPPNKWQAAHKEEYHSFLRRALFPGETKYALDIYEGLFNYGDPVIKNFPSDGKMNFIIDNASADGDGLKQIQVRLNSEQMAHGMRCLLLEVTNDLDKPCFIQEYTADKFLRIHFAKINGKDVPDFVLLNESTYNYDLQTFKDVPEYKIRVLALDENGFYYQRGMAPHELLHGFDVKNPPDDGRTEYPHIRGKYLQKIPFVCCTASGVSGKTLEYPPLLSVAEMELKLYMAMAHHSQHIYMNTQEFLVFSGVGKNFKFDEVIVGAGAGVSLDKPDAKAYYCSTNGVGFTAEKEEIEMLNAGIQQKRLSLMSAKSHQSGSVVGMEQTSKTAPLRTIVEVSGVAMTKILQFMAEWMGYSQDDIDKIKYHPSFQFANAAVNLSEFIALSKAVYAGEVKMLDKDLFRMALDSGYIKGTEVWEDFIKRYNIESAERRKYEVVLPQKQGNPFVKQNEETSNESDQKEN